ncbi:hypothetical protein DFH08DRAFT_816798 [Mycena albidolilacea]|uniref:Uncharacterized protein n=1 Tax=Mycena albidolilacea TaxID=1033008 RepID=A0AAD7EJB5_9AGAR|nr:hypothetical protein DFH08DRAFT_816798 [Mycena albidolilacea]
MASQPSPQALLGPYYFGVILNSFLYGTLSYYQNYKMDKIWLRAFVLYLFIVESLNTGICVAMIYEPLVQQFVLPSQPFLEAAIFVPVQCFYAWRIYIIIRNRFAPALICMASLSSLIGAVWTAAIVNRVKAYEHKPQVDHTALVWSCSAAGVFKFSIQIATHSRNLSCGHNNNRVTYLEPDSIQTGGVTVAFTILDVALFVALPNSTLSFVFDFALPKLYSNALISTFNVRSTALPAAVNLDTMPAGNMLFLETHQHVDTSASIVFNKPPSMGLCQLYNSTKSLPARRIQAGQRSIGTVYIRLSPVYCVITHAKISVQNVLEVGPAGAKSNGAAED